MSFRKSRARPGPTFRARAGHRSNHGLIVDSLQDDIAHTVKPALLAIAGAAASSHALKSLLFGIAQLDPITYAGVILLLAVVAALACATPAWRASRVDPSITLRAE